MFIVTVSLFAFIKLSDWFCCWNLKLQYSSVHRDADDIAPLASAVIALQVGGFVIP